MKNRILMAVAFVAAALLTVATFTGWMDFDAQWKPHYLYIPAAQFGTRMAVDLGSTVGVMVGPGIGVPELRQNTVARTGLSQFAMATNDEVSTGFPIPSTVDNRFGVAFRVFWYGTDATNAATGAHWSLKVKVFNPNVVLTAATGTGTDSISFAQDSTGGANRVAYTQWDTVTYASVDDWADGDYALLTVRLLNTRGAVYAPADSTRFVGVQMAYVPKLTTGGGYRGKRLEIPGPSVLGQAKGSFITRP